MSKKIYLVTGSSGNIGSAIILELLKDSENIVFAFDKTFFPQQLFDKDLIKGVLNQHVGDVMNESSLEELKEAISLSEGQLHGIVNAFYGREAAIKTKFKYEIDPEIDQPGEKRSLAIIDALTNYSSSDFLNELNVNIIGIHNIIRVFTPMLLASKYVSVINFASAYGIKVPNQDLFTNRKKFVCKLPGYSTSKAGVISYTEYLASIFSGRENDNLLRFNCISPGNIFANHSEDFVRNFRRFVWNSRMPTVEDVIPGIMYLLSPSSSYVNGTTLEIDGGWVRK